MAALTNRTSYLKPRDGDLKKLMNLTDCRVIYFPSFQLKDDKIGRKNKQTQNRDPPSFQPELRKSIVPDYSSNQGISE